MNAIRSGMPAALACVLFAAGCGSQQIDTTYGKRRGEASRSVNGTAVLSRMFEQSGHQVGTWNRLSPKIRSYDTIVWVPDSFQLPGDEQREFLESWLTEGPDRTLIYIGRDFDAGIGYWEMAARTAPPDQVEESLRRKAHLQAWHDSYRLVMETESLCPWFKRVRDSEPRRLSRLEGSWADAFDPAKADLRVESRIEVPARKELDDLDLKRQYRFERLLHAGDNLLVTRIRFADAPRGRILLLANGSFVLNLPLVNHENRRIAQRLIDQCGAPGRVAFLESSGTGPQVYEQEPESLLPSPFAMLTIWPLGPIMMHLAVLGIAYCFAVFPVFGRPREMEPEGISDFGKHIGAVGELSERSRDVGYARQRVDEYRVRTADAAGPSLHKRTIHQPRK